jgi:hypothetical protein
MFDLHIEAVIGVDHVMHALLLVRPSFTLVYNTRHPDFTSTFGVVHCPCHANHAARSVVLPNLIRLDAPSFRVDADEADAWRRHRLEPIGVKASVQ